MSKRQKYSLWLRLLAPPDAPRERLERLVPHLAADSLACALSLAEARLGVTLARAARDFVGIEGWRPHGYARLGDYACEELDRSGRWLRDLATLGEGLGTLPDLERALWGGDGARPLGRVAATSIARVATPESAPAWIALARRSTVRSLRNSVRAARQAGSSVPQEKAMPEGSASPLRRVLDEAIEDVDLSELKLSMPRPVRVAFEEALDLHRAVTGHQASLASFAEALAAEALAGPRPPDLSITPYVPGPEARETEEQLAQDFRMWASLGMPVYPGVDVARALASGTGDEVAPVDPSAGRPAVRFDPTASDTRPEMAAARSLLRRVEALTYAVPNRDVKLLGIKLHELVAIEDEIQHQLGRLLAEMDRRRDWPCLHFRSLGHYAEQRLGMCRRTAERYAGIDRALRKLPLVLAAYRLRTIGLHSAWLLHGILAGTADPKLERAWVARARDVGVDRLREDIRWVQLRRHRLLEDDLAASSESSTESSATEEQPDIPRKSVPYPPTDEAWFRSLQRVAGMSRQRLARLGWQALDPASDNVFLRLRMPDEIAGMFMASIEGARRQLEESVRATAGVSSESPPSAAAARLSLRRGAGVPAWAGLLALLEDYVRTWDDPRAQPRRRWTSTYERDGWRCMAPGCTARCRLQDHHIHYRAHQGSDEPWNQLCLCEFHHLQGEHGILAWCRGKAPLEVIWRLGRPDLATWWRNGRRLPPPTTVEPGKDNNDIAPPGEPGTETTEAEPGGPASESREVLRSLSVPRGATT
jgi:hypothetical protein